ncbi:MAG: alkaline phosphatase D family protein, partial [Microthrixaceae bacterium]
AGAAAVAGCAPFPGLDPPDGPWDCGVASGLHSSDAAVLWARFAPAAASSVEFDWQVAVDPGFTSVVADGKVTAGPDTDGCAKVLAEGLAPGTDHWYRFTAAGGMHSPTGHTRTPAGGASSPDAIRLAVASCQDFSSGFYPAWRAIAEADLDGVLHLGDYIYESAGGPNPLWGVRDDPSEAAVDLATYRAKYRMYRTDPDLRAAHAAHAFAPVWDDHEFVNDCDSTAIREQPTRAADAYRAWFEYQPVWPIDGTRIHRRLRFGDLVDLSLLDTRQYRDPNPENQLLQATHRPPASIAHAPGRSLMGLDQRTWLLDGLGSARGDGVTWNVIGQQVMIAPLRWIDLDEPVFQPVPEHAGVYFNLDQWDGYSAERDTLTEFLHANGIANTAILTGDIHSFWQSSLHLDIEDPASPAVAQEFVCGSVSSSAVGFLPDVARAFSAFTKGFAPWFRWVDWERRGFGLLTATPAAMSVDYKIVDPRSRASLPNQAVKFDWTADTTEVAVTG